MSIKFILRIFFVCLITTGLLFFYHYQPASAIEYGGFGGRPAFPDPNIPRSQSIFIHTIKPQESIQEGVRVINNSNSKMTFLVYATDDTPSTDGGYACKQYAEKNTNVGNWIKLKTNEITLQPATNEIVPFTITIPQDVDVGEHNGCIIIQEKKEVSKKGGMQLSVRTGIRVALTRPGKIIRLLQIEDYQILDKNEQLYILKPTIRNAGNVSVNSDIKVLVTNSVTGKDIAFGGQYSVLKSNPLVLNFEFNKPFWGGIYKAKTIVSYSDNGKNKTLESKTISFTSYPQKKAVLYVILVLLPLVLIVIFFIYKNKRNRRSFDKSGTHFRKIPLIGRIISRTGKNKIHNNTEQNFIYHKVHKGENISDLAHKYTVDWEEIAKLNNLKPPYVLVINRNIKIPVKQNEK